MKCLYSEKCIFAHKTYRFQKLYISLLKPLVTAAFADNTSRMEFKAKLINKETNREREKKWKNELLQLP